MKKGFKIVLHIILMALLVFVDRISKYLVVENLSGGREKVLIPGVFKLIYHQNSGAVWGIFSGRTDMLSVVSFLILAAIVVFYCILPWDKPRLKGLRIILVFISAGAIGNLIDRISLKYVVDFLYFELIDFPVFNIADCYITVSTFLLLFLFIFYYKEDDFDFLKKDKKQLKDNSDGQND